jgi:hypothetical protein
MQAVWRSAGPSRSVVEGMQKGRLVPRGPERDEVRAQSASNGSFPPIADTPNSDKTAEMSRNVNLALLIVARRVTVTRNQSC